MFPLSFLAGGYAKLIAAGLLLAAVVGAGWYVHHQIWQSGYDARDAIAVKDAAARLEADNAAILTATRNNERIADQQVLDNQKIKKGHANEIAQIRAAVAADRLRIPAATGCGQPASAAETNGTSGSDGRDTGTRLVSEATQRDFEALALKVGEVFAGCRAAQQFIRDQQMAP